METEAVLKNLQQQVTGLHELLIMEGSDNREELAGYFSVAWQDRVNRRLEKLEAQVKSIMLQLPGKF